MADENTTTETRTTQRTQTLIELKEAEERPNYATQQAQSFRASYELRERAERLQNEKPDKASELEDEAKKHDAQIAQWRKEELTRRSYDHRIVRDARREKEAEKDKEKLTRDFEFEP